MDPYGRIQQPTEQELEGFMAQQYQSEPEGERHDPGNADHVTTELMKPFPPSAIKVSKYTGLSYVAYQQVIRRLITVTGNRFSVDVEEIRHLPWPASKSGTEQTLVQATVKLTIPVLASSRTHMGVQVGSVGAGEDMWKGAVSDGIKKAAQSFGVAIDLAGMDGEDTDLVAGGPQGAPQQAQRPPQAPAPIRPQNGPQQASQPQNGAQQAQGGTQGGSRPATDNQKRALWAISGANKQQIDTWAAEYSESNDTITFGTASALIKQYGGNQ